MNNYTPNSLKYALVKGSYSSHPNRAVASIKTDILKNKVGIQAIKSTETRGMIALQHSSVRKSPLW